MSYIYIPTVTTILSNSSNSRRTLTMILVISFFLTIVSVSWMAMARQPLVIPGKTRALFSLETAFSRERVQEVKLAWSHQLAYAQKVNNIDFFFLVSYSLFFLFSVLWLYPLVNLVQFSARTLLSLVAIAFVFDVFEGIASHYWLMGIIDRITPPMVTITAIIKFVAAGAILLILSLAYLQVGWKWIKRNRPAHQPSDRLLKISEAAADDA